MTMTQKQLRFITIATLMVLLFGMTFYHYIEGLSWNDAFYFCIVTLATVGYGDISPHTEIGKFFTALYILIGLGIFASFINLLSRRRVERFEERESKKE